MYIRKQKVKIGTELILRWGVGTVFRAHSMKFMSLIWHLNFSEVQKLWCWFPEIATEKEHVRFGHKNPGFFENSGPN